MYCRNVRRGLLDQCRKMTLFLIVALLLGLALEPPFRKLNHMIEKSKEKTGLMI